MGHITCSQPQCSQFWVQDGVQQRFERTGEEFYCPFGHKLHFSKGPDPKDAEIKRLQARADMFEKNSERTYRVYQTTEEARTRLFKSLMVELRRRGAGVYRTAAGWAWVAPCQRSCMRLASTEKEARTRQVTHEKKHKCRT